MLDYRVKTAAQFLSNMIMNEIRKFYRCVVAASKSFANDNAMKFSASLSYYTIFALGPILLLIISFAGIFWRKDAVQGKIFAELRGPLGNTAAYTKAYALQFGGGIRPDPTAVFIIKKESKEIPVNT